jgi:hypothetical protein
LRVVRGNQAGLVIPLQERAYLMGRAISHQDVGPGRLYFHDPSVALIQARLLWDENGQDYVICQETNSSRSSVSGLPLTRGAKLRLRSGSRVKLGSLVVVVESLSGRQETAPDLSHQAPTPQMATWSAESADSGEDSSVAVAAPPDVPETPDLAQTSYRVDVDWFPVKVYPLRANDALHGPVAEFFPNGHLKRLAVYHQGQVSTAHNQMWLEEGAPLGRVVSDFCECVYAEGQETVMTQVDGEVDFFEEEIAWEAWVKKWLQQICANHTVSAMPQPG